LINIPFVHSSIQMNLQDLFMLICFIRLNSLNFYVFCHMDRIWCNMVSAIVKCHHQLHKHVFSLNEICDERLSVMDFFSLWLRISSFSHPSPHNQCSQLVSTGLTSKLPLLSKCLMCFLEVFTFLLLPRWHLQYLWKSLKIWRLADLLKQLKLVKIQTNKN